MTLGACGDWSKDAMTALDRYTLVHLKCVVREHQAEHGSESASPLTCAEVLILLEELTRLRGKAAAASEPDDFDIPDFE